VIVREARPDELSEVGEIRVNAYLADGFLSPESSYAPTLRALGATGEDPVLVAVAGEDDSQILGTVMLQRWPHAGQVVTGPDEAEIRALAVVPDGQGRGTGQALLRAVIERAARSGVRHLVLLTQPEMQAAQHLYRRAGFRRLPERDWSPAPGVDLLAYGLALPPHAALSTDEGDECGLGAGPRASDSHSRAVAPHRTAPPGDDQVS
jgi:ribosomal protein S18 acetylase RimI-like enzyme